MGQNISACNVKESHKGLYGLVVNISDLKSYAYIWVRTGTAGPWDPEWKHRSGVFDNVIWRAGGSNPSLIFFFSFLLHGGLFITAFTSFQKPSGMLNKSICGAKIQFRRVTGFCASSGGISLEKPQRTRSTIKVHSLRGWR